jgi:hypothetical protein
MPAVVAIPQVVEELLVKFSDFFPNAPSVVCALALESSPFVWR